MIGTYAKRLRDADYPWGPTREEREAFFEEIRDDWGGPVGIEERAPSVAARSGVRDVVGTYLRMGASPGAAVALTRMNAEIDIRDVLPTIRVPTLVLHRTDDRCLKVEEGRYVASRIPGARFVELPGDDHLPFVGDQDAMLDEIERFVIGAPSGADRTACWPRFVHARSTEGGGCRVRRRRRARVRLVPGRTRRVGRRFVATFDGPRARSAAPGAGRGGRAPRRGPAPGCTPASAPSPTARPRGAPVDLASSIAEHAAPGEVLVSRTVRDIVATLAAFEEHGVSRITGMGKWLLDKLQDKCDVHVIHGRLRRIGEKMRPMTCTKTIGSVSVPDDTDGSNAGHRRRR